jgi:methylthioribose-1-phosphate isomerase
MRTIDWVPGDEPGSGHIRLIDQTRLPGALVELEVVTVDALVDAIRRLAVRGAPALGVAGAMGVALATRTLPAEQAEAAVARLRAARPTAVNLAHGVDLAWAAATRCGPAGALAAALALRDEDIAACRAMAGRGVDVLRRLVPDRAALTVLTLCNTGALAAVEHGTALGVIERLHVEGRLDHAVVCETRPLLQGARLTAWELDRMGARYELIVDSAAASLLASGGVDAVLVGADRIAANGDTANKIGTYGVALLARAHGIPFYVAAPSSTFDLSLPTGEAIPIEQRDPREVTHGFGTQTAPSGIKVYNPAFDVTPAHLITGIITEKGLIQPVTAEGIRYNLRSAAG